MSGLRVGEVRFRVYPGDHEPVHVHGFIGSGESIVILRSNRTVTVDVAYRLTRGQIRKVLHAAADAFDELIELWNEMHDG